MSDEKPGRNIADSQPNRDQDQASESPRISTDRRDNNSEENSSNAKKRAAPQKHDALDWANLVVLIFTFLAAFGAAIEAGRLANLTQELVTDGRKIADRQARLIARSMKISSDTLISSGRAWVVPRRLIVAKPILGKPLGLELQYTNVGKEPALNLTIGQTQYIWLNPAVLKTPSETAVKIGPNEICKSIDVPPSLMAIGTTVWPMPEPEERHNLELAGFSNADAGIVDDDFLNGKKPLIVKGCLGYRTFSEARFSQFCFIVRGPTDKWGILDCPIGNSAN